MQKVTVLAGNAVLEIEFMKCNAVFRLYHIRSSQEIVYFSW